MANGNGNGNARSYAIRDATKLVALLVLFGGGISNYFIFEDKLERAIATIEHHQQECKERDQLNSTSLQRLTEVIQAHLINAAQGTERVDSLNRELRRCCGRDR